MNKHLPEIPAIGHVAHMYGHSLLHHARSLLLAASPALSVVLGCGAAADDPNDSGGYPVSPDSATPMTTGTGVMPVATVGASTPVAMPPATGAPPPTSDEGGFIDDPTAEPPMVEGPDLDDMTACAGLELVPEEVEVEVPMEITTTTEVLQPVAFYVVLDNSSSMETEIPSEDPAATGTPMTRWQVAVSSLQAFVTSPDSEGLDVAIQYFNPPGQQGDLGDETAADPLCDGSFHSTPDVEMGHLPDNAQALVDSLTAARTATGTPTLGALTGGIAYCQAFEAMNAEENCVVVLVTDGVPSSCGMGGGGMGGGMGGDMAATTDAAADTLSAISAAGLAAGVETFTVGMDGVPPEGFTLLDAIALAGGTDCTPPDPGGESCNVSSTGSQGLVETLNSIRDTVTVTNTVTEVTTVIETQKLDCQWLIPEPEEEEGMINPDRVNVNLSLDGAEPQIIPSVEGEADCAANGGIGWYYDNAEAPTMIFACSESCSQIQNGVNPSVNILLGCEREVVQVMR